MNGAEALVRTLIGGGLDTCFANPGTSEMHFVAALDRIAGMRCVLCLFEGGATGAADGFARMAERPAATLLHCGPGLANGLANLHNAKKARSPMVNVVGDHASYHVRYDAPLTADVEATARPYSDWVRVCRSPFEVATDGAAAIAAARSFPGQIATLILPGDAAWTPIPEDRSVAVPIPPIPAARRPSDDMVEAVAAALRRAGSRGALLLGGGALHGRPLVDAGRIAANTGCRLIAPTPSARIEGGAGRVRVDRIPYPVDAARTCLGGLELLVLVGSKLPVGFFAYPGKPSVMTPPGCAVLALAAPDEDGPAALADLASALDAVGPAAGIADLDRPGFDEGAVITPELLAAVIATTLPDHAIVVDEGISGGFACYPTCRTAAPHDWLPLTGGSIGFGLPLATGTAIACPGRRVVVIQADGSALYTVQSLWTHAREGLDVTSIILNNRAYAILKGEFANVGARGNGSTALSMMSLDEPAIGWADIARGLGVPSVRAEDAGTLAHAIRRSFATPGPMVIDAVMPA